MNANDRNRHAMLTFRLANQYYALPVENVLEVVAMMTVTTAPDTPEAIAGMVNRHGDALPMLDLRIAFQVAATPPDESTLFIVAQGDIYRVGLIVDEILQVRYVDIPAIKVAHGASKYVNHIISTEQELFQQINLRTLYEDYLETIQS